MQNRVRVLMFFTGLLYLGPVLAGYGGFGWAVVPAFVAIFLLWTLILRPASWPRHAADWQRPGVLLAVAGQGMVQGVLVLGCFGLGRGLGAVLAPSAQFSAPPFSVLWPLGVSALSIPLCRLIWHPGKAQALDRFLDTALADITAAAAGRPSDTRAAQAEAARLLAPLQALPDDTPTDHIARRLLALDAAADPEAVAQVLIRAAQGGHASRAGLCALVLHATDLRNTDRLAGGGYPARAFGLIAGDAALLRLFARRSTAQLHDDPAAWWDSVNPETLHQAARACPEAAAALTALAELTVALTPPDPEP